MGYKGNLKLFYNIFSISKLKRINLSKHNRFLVDFLVVPLVFLAVAHFIFNKFTRLGFILDDIDYLEYLVGSKGYLYGFIRTYAMRALAFKPMSLGINWVINFKLFGLNPHNYFLFNITVHSVNSFLLYLLIMTSFELRLLSFVISLCYLVHPFNIEGIGWISGGFTSQNVVLFSCLTLITYYLYLKKFKKIFIILSYFSFACAFLAREDVILLPFLVVFFLFFLGRMDKGRIKEILGYLIVVILIMAARYLLLYPHVFEVYRWDFKDIPNALFRNKYYLDLALLPINELFVFGVASFLEKYKISLMLFKISAYLLLIPFIGYKIYKSRKTSEVRLLGFGLVWYCILSVPFNFMCSEGSQGTRYLSMSIIGILMAQAAVITIGLRAILRSNIYIKLLLVCFSFVMLLICNYLIIEGFHNFFWTKWNIHNQYYIATINTAIKRNPYIKTIKLVGFEEVVRFSKMLRLYPDYKNINLVDIDNAAKSEKDNESTLTIKYIDPWFIHR
jgi:hypothetical protein